MYSNDRQSGNSLISTLMALAIGGILIAGMNSLIVQDISLNDVSDITKLKAEVKELVHCQNTYYPPPSKVYAAACENTFPYDTTPCGDSGAPYLPALNQKGKPLYFGWTGAPKTLGNFQIRSCCPSGKLKVEYRIFRNGQPMKDKLNSNIVYDWASASVPYLSLKSYDKGILFPIGSPCGSHLVSSTTGNRTIVSGKLAVTGAACPGYPFMEDISLVLWSYEGIVTCPPNTNLVAGGVNCSNMGPKVLPGRSLTADSHPIREASMTNPDWVSSANRYGASCCGGIPPSGSLNNRIYAICETK